jgi:hypothetical protein
MLKTGLKLSFVQLVLRLTIKAEKMVRGYINGVI